MTKQSNEELFARYCMEEDPVKKEIIREQFFEQNKKYPHYFAKRFLNQMDYDEAISCCQLGLIKAFNSFSLDKNIKFATYAARIMMNEILMELRKITRRGNPVSLDSTISNREDDRDLFLFNVVEDNRQSVITTVTESEIIRSIKENFLPLLSEREQGILKAHLKDEPPTQRELAERYDITQSYVSRLTQTIFEKAYYFLQTGKIKEYVKMANNQRVKQSITIPEGTLLEQVRFMHKNFPDLKPKEIAEKLGKPTGTIATYLSQIRRAEEKNQTWAQKGKEIDNQQQAMKSINIPGNTLVEKIEYIRKDNPHFTVEQIAEALGMKPDAIKYYIKSIKEPKNNREKEAKGETEVTKLTLTDKIRSILKAHPDANIAYLVDELGVNRDLIEKFYPEEHKPTYQETPTDTEDEEKNNELADTSNTLTTSTTDTKTTVSPMNKFNAPIQLSLASGKGEQSATSETIELNLTSKEMAATMITGAPSELQINVKKEVEEIIKSHKPEESVKTLLTEFEGSHTNQKAKGANEQMSENQPIEIKPSISMISLQLENTNKDALQIMLNGVAAILQNGEVYDLTIDVKKKGE